MFTILEKFPETRKLLRVKVTANQCKSNLLKFSHEVKALKQQIIKEGMDLPETVSVAMDQRRGQRLWGSKAKILVRIIFPPTPTHPH